MYTWLAKTSLRSAAELSVTHRRRGLPSIDLPSLIGLLMYGFKVSAV